ncbi:hypothetical protein [Phytohabitans houttuyneae]|uniref:Uncharacterized protein n=1 Tax=Phytohabitans houttuyneae TaxID=1076126 RepID=A0A6V8KAR6_9ACTN|nr:hypothetical protein [Phytohabitans houttuyneae]GFJ79551.1 hypothetical protein Phou_037310 [Phytohabitans houttuyneae]
MRRGRGKAAGAAAPATVDPDLGGVAKVNGFHTPTTVPAGRPVLEFDSDTTCPNVANHVPQPAGYVAASGWADNAMIVAVQRQCDGCGRWALWVPKRADLRVAGWPTGTCDWGGCDVEAVAERRDPESGRWLQVCRKHTGIKPRRPSPGRGKCVGCQRSYALTVDGLVRLHSVGFDRCVGSGRAPRGGSHG